MGHTILKPEVIVRTALGMLQRELILPQLIQRIGFDQFRGVKDDTVNIKVLARLAAREYAFRNNRSSPIVSDDLKEQSFPITVDKHPYSAVTLTDEQLYMDIEDFGAQVLQPQVRAVAEKLEGYIATKMAAATLSHAAVLYDGDGADGTFFKALVDVRKILNKAFVPQSDRVVVMGANVEAAVLKGETLLRKVNESGTDSALREATLGRMAGFTLVGNVNSVDPDFCIAYHPSAFGYASAAPAIPKGVAGGSTFENSGFALRWLQDYDPDYMQDRSVVDGFAGVISVADERDSSGDLTSKNSRAVRVVMTGSQS